ncbi:peptidylprolyl isomerase [Candidatus Micrarchaeota archaeon CG_4_10_14_0_2_um_filter_55_9]|nr:MAG: hypothetical protein AUJ15_03915 [Candidatus Micrarchaeota archaeon CG1_02_55_41]PIO02755.1 MAG: peptidylprolyl isomerase [Candidatus Micrarchaeota archaeon CG09_land_8_20_14_0_10_55_25]PIZ91812.1 MAG: peptidylprolyl isomerase [Candidatus Micrarchaeota archaeon CG_4_10_14_0_2_um_filter_55_9]PJD00907.1 MAG: peptidylprolyl isomerase [Candidatus Micrarchaeota archaeon CG10_big_fil_rev_8_21_14_0_10_54_18]
MNEGDFAKIDYVGRVKGGKVFDATSEETAKKEGVYNERGKYGSVLVPVGKGVVLKGLDEELLKANKGDEKKVSFGPDKAFGRRNPELVKLVPMKPFKEQGIQPVPGMPIQLDGMQARVQSVSGGRVRVDFNHELAGKEVEYDYKVLEVYSKPEEKAAALGKDLLPEASVEYSEKQIKVKVPGEPNKATADYVVRKNQLIAQLLEFVGARKVVVEEEWAKPNSTH